MRPTPTILVTAFEPFAGADCNPSERVLEAIARSQREGGAGALVTAVLPVVAAEVPARLAALIDRHRPGAVLSLGEARGRAHVSVETVAVNRLCFREDNNGTFEVYRPVIEDGPAEYRSTFRAHAIARAVRRAGVACETSASCGTFCCNQVLYLALHHGARHQPRLVAGFIHLPSLPEQRVNGETLDVHMSLVPQVKAVRLALEIVSMQVRDRLASRRPQ